MSTQQSDKQSGKQSDGHTAGAFDIRNVIGGLIGVYGVIEVVMGIFGSTESEKTGGVNANLWAGLVMIVVGVAFIAWARLKPTVVPDQSEREKGEL